MTDLPYEPLLERDGVSVSRSPWGPADNIGRLNAMTPESRQAVLDRVDGSRMFDLSVEYFIGMPSWSAAGDPTYQVWMTHTPDGSVNDRAAGVSGAVHEKYSYCGDSISMYTHTGTHIDTLNHFGHFGMFWNGRTAEQDMGSRHWMQGGAHEFPPIVGRAVLLDVAASKGVDCLPDGYCITPEDLARTAEEQGTELRRDDIALIRTGRMRRWPDAASYIPATPGIGLDAARYLCEEAQVMCIGTDAISIDVDPHLQPETFVPVHGYLFATAGTPVIEVLDLEGPAAAGVHELAFIGTPLKLRGATGAPMRPVAFAMRP